ncbi:MAG TPA: FMN-binding negative transcriptional regulator [Spirochaetia bacterium]|nr:FMN-binding negative transcriptional regulator [Spirochaetia bacterium]
MYVPKHFSVTDQATIRDFIENHAFGTLVTAVEGRPIASHLLFAVSDEQDSLVLSGHMARANVQWKGLRADSEVLAIFQGPHTYVSPRWYASKSVPTWNYLAVHAYGFPQIISDLDELRTLLTELVDRNEGSQAGGAPFHLDDLPDTSVEGMMKAVVGFRIRVASLEASYKLSQNRTQGDRDTVVEGLLRRGDDDSRAVAAAMKRAEERREND